MEAEGAEQEAQAMTTNTALNAAGRSRVSQPVSYAELTGSTPGPATTIPRTPKVVVAMCGQCGTYVDDLTEVGQPCLLIDCETPAGRIPIMRRRAGWLCERCTEALEPDFFHSYGDDQSHYRDAHMGEA